MKFKGKKFRWKKLLRQHTANMPLKQKNANQALLFDIIIVYFSSYLETGGHDFTVKFKGEIYSWKNLSQLLRQHNIAVPNEDVLTAVLQQKNLALQSCKDKCFFDEREYNKSCFCDKACKTFRDCCLDFQSRYV